MRNAIMKYSLLIPLALLLVGAFCAAAARATPAICDRDKPNRFEPACVCPDGSDVLVGRLPSDSNKRGAEYVVCRPPFPIWNGNMVYASMGTVRLNPNEKEGTIVTIAGQLEFGGVLLPELLNQLGYGFAVAAPPQLLSVPEREVELESLARIIEDTLNPDISYVLGISQGAIPATRLLESDRFDGGISVCGPIGSFMLQVAYSVQLLAVVDYFFPELKLLKDPPPPFGEFPLVPVSTLRTWDDDAVEAIIGDPLNSVKVVQVLAIMENLSLPVAIDPPADDNVPIAQTIAESLERFASFTNDYVDDIGGNIIDTTVTDYIGAMDRVAFNTGIRRFAANLGPEAVSEYETAGLSTESSSPLVAIHNTGDHRVPFTHIPLYAEKSGIPPEVPPNVPFFPLPINRYGHCAFTPQEALSAFGLLVGLVEGP